MFMLLEESRDIVEVEAIMKVTKKTLFLTRHVNSFYGGYYETFTGLLGIIFFYFILFFNSKGEFFDNSFVSFISILLGLLVIVVVFIWRYMLPICFNRETKMVSYWVHGVLYQRKWEDIKFYSKTIATSKGNIHLLAFKLKGGRKIMFEKALYLSTDSEYIIQYMNYEEPKLHDETVNYIKLVNFEYKFSEIFLNILPKKITFSRVFFSPLLVVEILLYYVMFILNKVLPRRKVPKGLLAACGCEANEKIYG